MEHLLPELREDFERWLKIIEDDPYVGRYTLGIFDVLRAHYLIADFFFREGEGIGGVGPRDINLLHSTLARQLTGYEGQIKWQNGFQVGATLFFGLIKNHPFHDGNKRTAFLSALYHLWRLGRVPSVRQKEFELLAVRIASNQVDRYLAYKSFTKRDDPEVNFIAHFFRKNTRPVDHRHYTITYRQLDTILKRFGFALEDAQGNFITVVRTEEEAYWDLFRKKTRTVKKRLCVMPFPGWTRQVGVKELEKVRKKTGLIPENGVDSGAFFKGEDPLEALISIYQRPLKRLADK